MDEENELLKNAPKPTDEEIMQINALFPAFLFRRRKERKIWASCCLQEAVLDEFDPLMLAPHEPEERPHRYGCCGGYYPTAAPAVYEPQKCPICGTKVKVKELGRCGNGYNLYSSRRVIVLRWDGSALWALGYYAEKRYLPRTESVIFKPLLMLNRIWKFTPGKTEYTQHISGGAWTEPAAIYTKYLGSKWRCPDGFPYCAEWGTGYNLIGYDQIEATPWHYCNAGNYLAQTGSKMRFLALCTGYPQQVEMLLKSGLKKIVDDMVAGKLNARLLDWKETNVFKSFGVPKDVLRDWMQAGAVTEVLVAWKQINKKKKVCTLEELLSIYGKAPYQFEKTTRNMINHGLSVEKLINYIGRCETKSKKRSIGTETKIELWNDYIYAAERIGYDLENPVFLLPKNLSEAHDKATEAFAVIQKEKKNADYREKRMQKLKKKYTFWSDRWLIRPPTGAEEIIAEGKALKHCVGGYAARHIDGKVTILFLRDKKRPGKPLVTIQMCNNAIVQIHGWDDERTKCPENPYGKSPRDIYREFLDDWLSWLIAGSRKDKKGYPIIFDKEEKTA